MKFIIAATKPVFDDVTNEVVDVKHVHYFLDNMTSEIWDADGNPVNVQPLTKMENFRAVSATSINTPSGKSQNIRTLKIQLGLSCNYSCEYCSQRFVPNIEHANSKLLDRFLNSLDDWLIYPPGEIEFWGGEPLVYWKNMKPLAEALRERFPFTKFLMISNGSMLTDEIVDWLVKLDFSVGISHDGPGQNVRGPDPLDNPEQRRLIMKLFKQLLPKGKISFNSMVHRENLDRAKIQKFFEQLFGESSQFSIGEGSFIDVYDEGGMKNTLQSHAEHLAFRRMTLDYIHDGAIDRFQITGKRMQRWINAWGNKQPASSIGQKCGMDFEGDVTVDLMGNVLTCQNVTVNSKAHNGKSHRIGHVNKFEDIKLNTSTHWSHREVCRNCPLVQVCQGSCMFLEGEYFKKSCDSAYSDHIPFFAKAFEAVTGALPYGIQAIENDYRLPEERSNLWGNPNAEVYAPPTRQEPFLG